MSSPSDKRRLLAALTGETPSEAPFFEEVIEQRPAEYALGRPLGGDTRRMPPEDYVALALRLGIDAVVAHSGGWLPGGRYTNASDGSNHYLGGAARTERDLLAQPFDPAESRRSMKAYVTAAAGTGAGVMAWLPGLLSSPAIAIGYTAISYLLYDDFPFVERACEVQYGRTLQAVHAAADAGVDALGLGDDISDCNGPMMQPVLLRQLWLPRARALCEAAHQRSLPIMLHCCGHTGVVLELAKEAGFDAIQPVAACNDLDAILAARGRMTVLGTIDVGSVLVRGTPALVGQTVRKHWEAYGPTGFVLGSNHSLNDAVPAENVWALAEAVGELRRP